MLENARKWRLCRRPASSVPVERRPVAAAQQGDCAKKWTLDAVDVVLQKLKMLRAHSRIDVVE